MGWAGERCRGWAEGDEGWEGVRGGERGRGKGGKGVVFYESKGSFPFPFSFLNHITSCFFFVFFLGRLGGRMGGGCFSFKKKNFFFFSLPFFVLEKLLN